MIELESNEAKDRIIITLLTILDNVVNKGYELNKGLFTDEGFVMFIEDLQPIKTLKLISRIDSTRFYLKVEDK